MQQLVDYNDFVLLQELCLHSSEGHKIYDELSDASVHFVSGMPDDELHSGRPYGSCCIICKSNLKCCISPVQTATRRICAVKVETDSCSPFLIINVYMPCDTYDAHSMLQTDNDAVLGEISSLANITGIDCIIIGSDLNTDLSHYQSTHTDSLLHFVNKESLSLLNNLPCYNVDLHLKVVFT